MSSMATSLAPKERLEVLFGELAELAGQRNAIDGRVVEIVAEIDHGGLCGMTGAQSVSSLVAWKLGLSSATGKTIATVAHRIEEFPRCVEALRDGRLSLDQVGVIAGQAPDGSDEFYANFAAVATVNQIRTAIKLEPPPQPQPQPDPGPDVESDPDIDAESDSGSDADAASEPAPATDVPESAGVPESGVEPVSQPQPQPQSQSQPVSEPPRSITRTEGEDCTTYQIVLPHAEAAIFDAALQSHHDALIAQWKRDHTPHTGDGDGDSAGDRAPGDRAPGDGDTRGDGDPGGDGDTAGPGHQVPPFPGRVDGLMSLVQAGWDTDVARRPHGQHTTVVVHLDVEHPDAALHLGPFLSAADRKYLLCNADCEIWFQRHGHVIGSARATRTISRRLRRALEHRDRCCVVPGCGATRGLHAHHIQHWEDGGPTDLCNLKCLSLPSPAASPRWHHHHRNRRPPDRHRRHRHTPTQRIPGTTTHHTPTHRSTLPRTDRRTRRLVVVQPLPTTTTTHGQLTSRHRPWSRRHRHPNRLGWNATRWYTVASTSRNRVESYPHHRRQPTIDDFGNA